jgi:hypothetical protein
VAALLVVAGTVVKWEELRCGGQENGDARYRVEGGQSARGVVGERKVLLPCVWWKGRRKGRGQLWWW